MKSHFCVAIDGPGGAGKGAAAQAVAKHYGIHYVDTGAIYRAVALAVLRSGTEAGDTAGVLSLLPGLSVDLRYRPDGTQETLLNGEDVSGLIRTEAVSSTASGISGLPEVRAFLLETQQSLARRISVVMDGRDIGTVVLPEAEVKIFLTADLDVRARRRWLERTGKGESVTLEEVREQLRRRDEADGSRETAPMRPAPDAVLLDNSKLDVEGTAAAICRIIDARLAEA